MRRALVAFALAAATGGCILTSSFDGLTGGAAAGDGGGADGDGADGGAGAEGGANDGGAGADAIAPFTCPKGATLCSTFDVDPPYTGWTQDVWAGQGTLAVDTAVSVSPPRSLIATAHSDAAQEGTARLYYVVPKTNKRVRVSFDFYWSDPPDLAATDGASLIVAEINCQSNETYDGFWLKWGKQSGQRVFGVINNRGASFTTLPEPPQGVFTRIVMDATWNGSASIATFTIGDAPPVNVPQDVACPTYDVFQAIAGLHAQAQAAGTARYDDVVVELDPTD